MAKRSDAVFARQGYHHGNLKEALVEAARRLIAERGPSGFTLTEAAKLAGVSAAAPYRHFKDRDALIAEVAQRGFAAFGSRLAAAWSGAEADPVQAFSQMGETYLAFAREEPGFYGAMFARSRPQGASGSAGGTAFAALESAIARVAARMGADGSTVDARILAYQVWAFSHGIATLTAGGLLPGREPALQPQALLRHGVAALIAGAAPARSAPPRSPRRQK
jgi:AcrR family transcriptional regulator